MNDHDRYRDNGIWLPFYADGCVNGGASHTTLQSTVAPKNQQPIGFRGAAPGRSFDERGLPRVRVKARGIPLNA